MFTLGSDPEIFLLDKKDNPISAHDLVPGHKKSPAKLERGVMIQADGTACEFNTKPAKTAKEFKENVLDALEQVRAIVPKECKLAFKPSVFYPKTYFNSLPEAAKELGCDPDFNAATGGVNPTPTPKGKYETMRTAAGHVHFGWTEKADIFSQSHRFDCQMIAARTDARFRKIMHLWDQDKDRATLYGKNAAYRPKHYGCEYRALSCAWLKYPNMYPFIFDTCKHVYDKMLEGEYYETEWNGPLFASTKYLNKTINF
jgi:hypothetical protein